METKAASPAALDPPDVDLVIRTRNGDQSAFGELIRRHQKTVYRIAYRMLRDHDGAEDVTQITFVKAFRSLHRFREEFSFHPWLYRIAVNCSLTQIDRRKRERKVDIADVPESALPRPAHEESPLEEAGRRELLKRVDGALEKIPTEQKTVFLLRVAEGLSYEEIARTLDIPKGTVMSRLSRAREALRGLLV
jgi:RNA polymerase sigma-70 factor (ECF subfamily)